jgi:hypothetical protein
MTTTIHELSSRPITDAEAADLIAQPPPCPFWCTLGGGHAFDGKFRDEYWREHRSADAYVAIKQHESIVDGTHRLGRVAIDLTELEYWYPTVSEVEAFIAEAQAVLEIVRRLEAGR